MSTTKCSVLIVDDEPYILPTLAALISRDFEVLTASSADAAQAILERRSVDIILTDQRMPRRTGIQLLEWVRQNRPQVVRLLMTGFAELDDAIDAINLDGGGSSELWIASEGGIINRPSDGQERSVVNHLGIRITSAPGW